MRLKKNLFRVGVILHSLNFCVRADIKGIHYRLDASKVILGTEKLEKTGRPCVGDSGCTYKIDWNLCFSNSWINMYSEARSGDNAVRRETLENTHRSTAAVANDSSSLSILEHYLYGKNVVRAIDMQNFKQQRTSDETEIERNNNRKSFLLEACDVCLAQKEGTCFTHAPFQSLHRFVHAEDHGKGSNIKATYAVMSFPDEVQLCTSSIPGYIYGACARRHLPSGTWIGPYEGQRTFDQRNSSFENQDYLWEIYTEGNFSHFIDGNDENCSSWMRFIRCARNKKEQNMAAYQCGQNIYYRSFREISVGEELLVWYSDSYLKHLEIPLSLKETDQLKIEEVIGNFNEKGPTVSLAAPASQVPDCTSSIPEPPRPFPPKTAISQSYPEHHTTTSYEPSFSQIENAALLRLSEPVTPTVQKALADQVKKRIEKGKYLQGQELPRIEEKEEQYVCNEFPKEERNDFQDQMNWSDYQHQANTSDFHHPSLENYEREGYKAAVVNDLCLPFKCRQCLKVFTQRIQLQMHVCPKEPYKPFQCGHCSLSFAQPSELRNHVVVHSSERPFKCGFCGRSFAGATTLNNHVRTHTGERPFVCKSCGKTFAIATQLARHSRVPGECPGHVSSTHGTKYASQSCVGND